MGKGKQYELDIKRAINENTSSHVKAHRPDFSGNSAGEAADVMVVWQADRYDDQVARGHPERHVAYGELKKRSGEEGKRTTVMSGSSENQNGLGELRELRHELPYWAKKVVAVKFPHRELIVMDAGALEHWLRRDEEGFGHRWYEGNPEDLRVCEDHGARLTPSNNISMVMPSLDWWPSSRSGVDDWRKLATSIGLEEWDFS